MKRIVDSIRHSEFLKHNIVFFIGTLFIAVFNYTYYPVISRLVNVSDFGEIQASISLFMQFGIVLTAFGYVVVNITTNTIGERDKNEVVLRLEQAMLIACLVLLVVLSLFAPILQNALKLHSVWPVILVGVLIYINVPATTRTYVLQAHKRLSEVSISGIIFAVGKIAMSIVFIAITNDVVAALSGYIVAQILTLIYLELRTYGIYQRLRHSFARDSFRTLGRSTLRIIKAEVTYGFVICAVLFGLALLYSSDTVLARPFFDAHTLGIYSGISSIARVVFFVTASIAGVLVVSVTFGNTPLKNRNILLKSSIILIGLGGTIATMFALAPTFFTRILLGDAYVMGALYLPALAGVMLICSLNNLWAIYQISLRRHTAVTPVIIGVGVMAVSLVLNHSTVWELIGAYALGNGISCVLLLSQIVRKKDNTSHG